MDLRPENFSNEIILRVNLEPLHLMGNLIDKILASDNTKLYVRIEKSLKKLPHEDKDKTSILL